MNKPGWNYDPWLNAYVTEVDCDCDNGYRGVDGHTCERCDGSGFREIAKFIDDSDVE